MQLKFKHKVFLTFFANSLVIVVCLLFLGRYYAHRNFEQYIRQVEDKKLNDLAAALGQEYRRSGGWNGVQANWGHWSHAGMMGPGGPPKGVGEPLFSPPPPKPPMERRFREGEPPPDFKGGERRDPPPFGSPPPGPPPGESPQHLALFDAERQPLTGTALDDGYQLIPIQVNGQVAGWLGSKRFEGAMPPLDVEFLRHQSQTFYSIGGVALALAALVTFVLSRHLLEPVKVLAEGTRALTSRRFDTRIETRSQDEFGQLVADFNAMAQGLEKYEQMRRQWIADISHELRTPLAVLRAEIEAMQDGVRKVSQEALDSLHFEVMHVSRIVHDLHDLSLIESGAFRSELTAVSPLEVLEDTLRSFKTRFNDGNLRIEADEWNAAEATVMADSDRLRQLFSNLFENTLRYVHAPGVLKISHGLTPGCLRLRFEDSGPGVPEESLERLFDRLYRVDKARGRAQGGSGLGLAICRGIVGRFGGSIEASKSSIGGLKITVTLPTL
ncbi:MAG: ATP-binding protein [Acidobacteriota bacterium]